MRKVRRITPVRAWGTSINAYLDKQSSCVITRAAKGWKVTHPSSEEPMFTGSFMECKKFVYETYPDPEVILDGGEVREV